MIDICLFIILLLLYKCLVTYIKYYEIYGIWLTDYYSIFRLIFGSYDLIPTVTKKNFKIFTLFQTAMNSVFIYKYIHYSLIYFIQNISSSLKNFQIATFRFFIARKMIRIFLVVCAILIFASMYGLFIGEFAPEEFTLNVGLLFYALFLLVIACIININGSF